MSSLGLACLVCLDGDETSEKLFSAQISSRDVSGTEPQTKKNTNPYCLFPYSKLESRIPTYNTQVLFLYFTQTIVASQSYPNSIPSLTKTNKNKNEG